MKLIVPLILLPRLVTIKKKPNMIAQVRVFRSRCASNSTTASIPVGPRGTRLHHKVAELIFPCGCWHSALLALPALFPELDKFWNSSFFFPVPPFSTHIIKDQRILSKIVRLIDHRCLRYPSLHITIRVTSVTTTSPPRLG